MQRHTLLAAGFSGLTACTIPPSPLPPTQGNFPPMTAIHGQIADLSAQPDSISFPPYSFLPHVRALVNADGHFTLSLPTDISTDDTRYGDPACTGQVQQSEPTAQFRTVQAVAFQLWKQQEKVGGVTTRIIQSGVDENYEYVYSTLATTIRGTQVCAEAASVETFDLVYNRGWNLVQSRVGSGHAIQMRSIPDQSLSWRSASRPSVVLP